MKMPVSRDVLTSPSSYYRQTPPQQQQQHHPMYHVPTPPMGAIPSSSSGVLMSSRMGHQPPNLPGGGGLYSMSDLPSPPSSFHMSMSAIDASTPTNMSMRGGPGGFPPHSMRGGLDGRMGDGASIRDLNNYLPVHKVKLEEYPKRLFTVENTVTRETIVVLTCSSVIKFYILKIKDDVKTASEKFEFVEFHKLEITPHDLEAFVISQNCSITLIPFKLTYALSLRGRKTVFVYDQGESNQIPSSLRVEDDNELIELDHDYPVTHLALDAEKEYLASIQELGQIVVWDIATKNTLATFHIPNQGVYISFHRSEPYQLMVIDSNGWARYFNVFRQCCYRSINLVQPGVFSADWSLSNSNIFAAGFTESFVVIDTSKLLSTQNKCYEVPEQIINAIKICPMDDKVFATLSRLTGTIQLWRDNFGTHIWKHRNTNINDIAWVHGYPYLLAVGHHALYIYESSIS